MTAPRLPRLDLADWLHLPLDLDPVEWAERYIDLSVDVTAATDGLLRLAPYQRAPILAQFQPGTTEVVVEAPPQTGKSVCWRVPVLYRIAHGCGPGYILYESDEKGADINTEQLAPYVTGPAAIPACRAKLRSGPHAATANRYRFLDGLLEFSGAGTPPTSVPRRFGVADELPTWPGTYATRQKTLSNFRDRFVRFLHLPDCCLTIVGSPQDEHDPVGDLFTDSTAEHWTLRCQKCRELTIPAHRIKSLQFQVDDHGLPVPGSERLVCPVCHHEHPERHAQRMNDQGDYLPTRRHPFRRGFHWGALAAPALFSWQRIAMASLEAGSTATREQHLHFAKSILGLPYRPRKLTHDRDTALREHTLRPTDPQPAPDRTCLHLFSADTQDDGWYWVRRALTTDRSTYLLAHGFARSWDELTAAWDAKLDGLLCAVGIIDQGGHRAKDVQAYAAARPGLYTYKGYSRLTAAPWKISNEDPGLILARPDHYKADLLWLLYHQPDRAGNYLYLPQDPDDDYLEQLADLKPCKRVKHGDRLENWEGTGNDHYFDAEKMLRVLLDYALATLKPTHYHKPPPWLYGDDLPQSVRARRRAQDRPDVL